MEALADTTNLGDLDENDPGSVARFMKRMGREMGDDLGDDFEGALDEAMAESESGGEGPAGAEESSDVVSSDSAETSES
jgi:hypothetical protein